jgi:hypothetical protein
LRELSIVFGSFTAAIGAVEGLPGASAALLVIDGRRSRVRFLSLRGTRPPDPVNEIATFESR